MLAQPYLCLCLGNSGGNLFGTLFKLGCKINNLPAAVSTGSLGKPVSQLRISRFVLGKRRLRKGVMGTPVVGMTPCMSHSYNHGDTLAHLYQKKRACLDKTGRPLQTYNPRNAPAIAVA